VLFFLSEYCHIILMSTIIALIFFGGWNSFFGFKALPWFWFSFKALVLILLFILIRAVLPRFRYDNLMSLLWKSFLPFSFGYFLFIFSVFLLFDSFPFLEC
jgi:NADH:ubiquinone oxidoreductase subunit H